MEVCNAAKDFQLRIGIHQSEVVFENEDVFGDGVNIASRIQSAAKPGCIYVSESVHHNVSNKKDINTKFIKEETLKNVKEPVRMYEVIIINSSGLPVENKMKNILQNSIAVLPFANMSSDPEQEYFSDGISEDIINMLAQVPGLKVAGRTSSFSFKGKNQDLRVIGEQLSVNHILEGSVRKSGNKLRITAQLINVSDGYHLYSEKFDRELEDIFEIQDEISLAILNAIKIKLFAEDKQAVLKRYTDNTDAYQLYLLGRFHYNKWAGLEGYNKAIEYYTQAIEKDPDYVLAYTGLAACYLNLWFFSHLPPDESLPKMKEATVKSLSIDDEIAECHVSLARMQFWYEWDFKGADKEFKIAIDLNPNHAEAHEQYGMFLGITERKTDAELQAKKALGLDPFSLMNNWGAGWTYWMIGDYIRMEQQGRRLIELAPDFYGGHLILGTAMWTKGKFDEALAGLEIAVVHNDGAFTQSWLGCLLGIMGEQQRAKEVLYKLLEMEKTLTARNFDLAIVYAGLSEKEKAHQYFQKGFEKHEGMMVFLQQWSKVVPWLKTDPEIIALAKKIGLP